MFANKTTSSTLPINASAQASSIVVSQGTSTSVTRANTWITAGGRQLLQDGDAITSMSMVPMTVDQTGSVSTATASLGDVGDPCDSTNYPQQTVSDQFTVRAPYKKLLADVESDGIPCSSTLAFLPSTFMKIIGPISLLRNDVFCASGSDDNWPLYSMEPNQMKIWDFPSQAYNTFGTDTVIAGTVSIAPSGGGSITMGGSQLILQPGRLSMSDASSYIDVQTYLEVGGVISSWSDTDNISYGYPGSVNGIYGRFHDDIHSQDTVYGAQAVVVGPGRQKHAAGLWIESVQGATVGTPATTATEALISTGPYGCTFWNRHGARTGTGQYWNGWRFMDDDVYCNRSLLTKVSVETTGNLFAAGNIATSGTVTARGLVLPTTVPSSPVDGSIYKYAADEIRVYNSATGKWFRFTGVSE